MTLTSTKTCPNCTADLETEFRYCPSCGQDAHIHRFNLPHIFHEVFHAFTHADKGVFKLTKALATQPGIAAREYVLEGKRKKYFNPFTFLLLVLGLNITVNSFIKPYTGRANPAATSAQQVSPAIPKASQPRTERQRAAMAFIEKHINIVGLVAIPVFTLVFWLYFRRTDINYAEHLVANVFFSSFFSLVSIIVTLTLGLLLNAYLPFLNRLLLLFQLSYLTVAYYQFLNYNRPIQYFKTGAATLLALLSWVAFSSGAIFIYILLG
ncbi:DUF3667 domain-containing protein [Spirosoma soli]|uniref:DUF3667 domain-containing protein n=1 Tax=Spirosoma soli TaxID=1770529 RepID=A0ABW5M096_9BACT